MKILHKNLSDLIIKTAIEVQKELGIGFLEKVYENSLIIALKSIGLKMEQQKLINVFFRSENVGEYFADIVVENKIILELKAVETLHPNHYAQLVNYLKASDYEVGM
jgi:GxxExxY protein